MSRKYCPDEFPITLYLNGLELATYQLTKADLNEWTVGYLYSEGIINGMSDIKKLTIAEEKGKVSVELFDDFDFEAFTEKQKFFTAGCGKGVTFFSMTDVRKFPKITTNQKVPLSYLLKKRHEFAQNSPLYLETGGMHGACIIENDGKMTVREDIGRHNAIDKVIGYAISKGLDPKTLILLTTGRVSYEMLSKAARLGVGLIGSRTAATKQAVQLANFLQIEIVGYLRGKIATIYTSQGKVENDLMRTLEQKS